MADVAPPAPVIVGDIPALDGLRMVAAIGVIWIHAEAASAPIRGGGPAGTWLVRGSFFAVDMLFVLSGFCQFLPIAAAGSGHHPNWRSYAIRRALRIIPAYYVALAATGLYIGRFSLGPGRAHRVVGIWELVIHLTFLQHVVYGIEGQEGLGVNTAMWTLTAEAAFYIVLPFVALWFLRHPLAGLVTALALAVGWRVGVLAIAGQSEYAISQTPAFVFHFAVGMAAAVIVVRVRAQMLVDARFAAQARRIAGAAVIWGAVACVAWFRAADPLSHPNDPTFLLADRFVWNLAPTTAFAILVGAIVVCPAWLAWPFGNPVARWAGKATYGTYLFHSLVLLEIARTWRDLGHRPLSLWQVGVAATVEALLLGRLSYLLVEEPARRLSRRLAARWTTPAARARRPPVAGRSPRDLALAE